LSLKWGGAFTPIRGGGVKKYHWYNEGD